MSKAAAGRAETMKHVTTTRDSRNNRLVFKSKFLVYPAGTKLTRKASHARPRAEGAGQDRRTAQGPRDPAEAAQGMGGIASSRPEPGRHPKALRPPRHAQPLEARRRYAAADPRRVPAHRAHRLRGA